MAGMPSAAPRRSRGELLALLEEELTRAVRRALPALVNGEDKCPRRAVALKLHWETAEELEALRAEHHELQCVVAQLAAENGELRAAIKCSKLRSEEADGKAAASDASADHQPTDDVQLPSVLGGFQPLAQVECVKLATRDLPALEQAVLLQPSNAAAVANLAEGLHRASSALVSTITDRVDTDGIIRVCDSVAATGAAHFASVYHEVWRMVERSENVSAYETPMSRLQALAHAATSSAPVEQRTGDVATLFADAAAAQDAFGRLVRGAVAAADLPLDKLVYDPKRLKSTGRILEKCWLRRNAPGSASRVCDVVRAMIISPSMADLARVLAQLASLADSGELVVVRVKDRISVPSAGWRDAMVNFYITSDPYRHICEVQVAHETLLTARKGLPGHAIYVRVRNALELLERLGLDFDSRAERLVEWRQAGRSAAELRRLGFDDASQCLDAGFTLDEMRRAGTSAVELARAGALQLALAEAGFEEADAAAATAIALIEGGRAEQQRAALLKLHGTDEATRVAAAAVLLPSVRHADVVVRTGAVLALKLLEPEALAAYAEVLVEMLEDDSNSVREAAFSALHSLGGPGLEPVTGAVAKRVEHPSPAVRKAALELLTLLEPPALSTLAIAIVRCIGDTDKAVRQQAVTAFGKLEQTVKAAMTDELARLFGGNAAGTARQSNGGCESETQASSPAVRVAAITALRTLEVGQLAKLEGLLAALVSDPHGNVRLAALDAFALLDAAAADRHIDVIVARLADCTPEASEAVIAVLRKAEESRVAALLRPLLDHSDSRGFWAVHAMAQLGAPVVRSNADSIVAHGLHRDDKSECREAIRALGKLPPAELAAHANAIAPFVGKDEDRATVLCALEALSKLPPATFAAVPFAAVQLGSFDEKFSIEICAAATKALALDVTGHAAHAACIFECLWHKRFSVRMAAVELLDKLQPDAFRPHVPPIAKRLEDHSEEARFSALLAMTMLHPADVAAHAPAITERLSDLRENVRRQVWPALSRLEPAALAPCADGFARRLTHADGGVREAALKLLAMLPSKQLVAKESAIARCLQDSCPRVFSAAVAALRLIQPSLDKHVGVIAERLKIEWDKIPRQVVLDTLAELDPQVLASHGVLEQVRAISGKDSSPLVSTPPRLTTCSTTEQ